MVVPLKVSASKFIETFRSNSNTRKFGVKVVNSYHKKLDSIMFSKMKMSFKYIKVRQKDRSRDKKLNKTKMEVKSNLQRRKKSEKNYTLFVLNCDNS